MESFKNINQLIEYPTGGIVSREVIKTDGVSVTLFCLAAGTAISEHTAAREGLVQVIEGSGVFNLGGEEIAMKPGVIIPMAESAPHSLRVEENTAFVLWLL